MSQHRLAEYNLIICQCDQMRACSVGCYGDAVVHTPHLDRLAHDGVRFETAISNNPVCTPARSCLLSGQYSRTGTGMTGNTHENPPNPRRERLTALTLPEVLRTAGYRTAHIGKWHIDPQPQLLGFESAVYPMVAHKHYGQTYFDETARSFLVDEFLCDYEQRQVESFLAHADGPFFLHYNISPPHQPIGPGHLPDRYLAMYDCDTVPLRPNVYTDGALAHDEFWFKVYCASEYYWDRLQGLAERAEDRLKPDFSLRDLYALYYGAITCVDDYVGALLAALDRYGLRERTLVVFTADHGDNLGSHGLFNKGTLNGESIRIPLIYSAPGGLAPGVDRQRIAQTIDIMPTVLELLGMPAPDTVQGRSLAPAVLDPICDLDPGMAVIESPFNILGLRTSTHLFGTGFDQQTRLIRPDDRCLYHLPDDPFERQNLAGAGTACECRLLETLEEWDRRTPWLNAPAYSVPNPWRAREFYSWPGA
ncbi:MAG: sulfatase-like hydrolase/transferase [Armatimonadota bacterium]